jgi:hypothetical protein
MLISAVLGSATCHFAHAQVREKHLMSKRNTCNMLAFAVFGGHLLAHMCIFAFFACYCGLWQRLSAHMLPFAVLGGAHARVCGTWLCICHSAHAQVRVERLMSMGNTCVSCFLRLSGALVRPSVGFGTAHAVLPMHSCVLNASCLREVHVICVHLWFSAALRCTRACFCGSF